MAPTFIFTQYFDSSDILVSDFIEIHPMLSLNKRILEVYLSEAFYMFLVRLRVNYPICH